jgi:hypothetical protein
MSRDDAPHRNVALRPESRSAAAVLTGDRRNLRGGLSVDEAVHDKAGGLRRHFQLGAVHVYRGLHVRARRSQHRPAANVADDCSVEVARHHATHVWMALEDLTERPPIRVGQADRIKCRRACPNRRVVHRDDRRPRALAGQLRVEPRELTRTKFPAVFSLSWTRTNGSGIRASAPGLPRAAVLDVGPAGLEDLPRRDAQDGAQRSAYDRDHKRRGPGEG